MRFGKTIKEAMMSMTASPERELKRVQMRLEQLEMFKFGAIQLALK